MTDSNESWFHPLISTRKEPSRLSRRRLFIVGGTGVAAAMASINGAGAQNGAATPTDPVNVDASGDSDAVALLAQAAGAMAELETFAFEVQTISGETTVMGLLTLEEIHGVVRRPYDFSATVEVSTPIGSLAVTASGIDGTAWIQNPLSDGEWISMAEAGDILPLVNPDTLILSSISFIQNATIDGTDRIDGQEVTRIAGTIDLAEAATAMAEVTESFPAEISSEPLDALVWIDEEHHVLEIEIAGAVLSAEPDNVIRSISFFDFDEPVEIEEPEI